MKPLTEKDKKVFERGDTVAILDGMKDGCNYCMIPLEALRKKE